ncbi:hypothetical protein BLA29_013477 [Euroglyphus maynei]|uniref:Cleft lip and palate transmembrane protein 1-like protein n=1 Tax=Euroglyphus maynei TaxID=6958 RepID=A0A1Y3BYI9_EURMA|nr:hypothetical protein BLA29_013477 [Euroglyphus maynei]
MPTMYRLGCFRDDIIFLIYVYQRWIYRVDQSRVNEFGVSGEELAQSEQQQQQQTSDAIEQNGNVLTGGDDDDVTTDHIDDGNETKKDK